MPHAYTKSCITGARQQQLGRWSFERAGSASTTFTDALDELDPAQDPADPEAAQKPREPGAGRRRLRSSERNTDDGCRRPHDTPGVVASDGQAGGTARPVLTAQTSLAKRRALEWEQRMKVCARIA